MDTQPDDAAILASVDTEPEAFALFYRRHVAGLLGHFLRRAHDAALAPDLCAETFAAALDGAHRFDRARGPAVAWLYDIARRLLAHAERRGAVEDRARRRLGMAPLDLTDAAPAELPGDPRAGSTQGAVMSEDFVRDLEEELVAAARFRAERRARRRAPARGLALRPVWVQRRRPVALAATLLAGAITTFVVIAAVTVIRGGDDRAADVPPSPAPSATLALPGMRLAPACEEEVARSEPAAALLPPMGVFRRAQHEPDGLPLDASRLPVTGVDARESRRPGRGRLDVELTLVPSPGVRRDGTCSGRDGGPGLCIVAGLARPPTARCFPATDVAAGRAVAQLGPALLVGVVPDGVTEVTLAMGDRHATAPVIENAYQAVLRGARPGAQIAVTLGRDVDCRRQVAPALPARITALQDPAQPGSPLPRAALDTLNWWTWQLDAIAADEARYWGGGDGVEFWVVPVVPRGSAPCAPASEVCVVAVPDAAAAFAHCVLEPDEDGASWRVGPLLPGQAVIYGVVPDGVDEADVTVGNRTVRVEAGLNVIGGVLPFPYRDADRARVSMIIRGPPATAPKPPVAVIAAGGDVQGLLASAGYVTTSTSATPQERTVVYWDQRRVTREETARIAGTVDADDRIEIRGGLPIPRAVLEREAPVVVVVGSG